VLSDGSIKVEDLIFIFILTI